MLKKLILIVSTLLSTGALANQVASPQEAFRYTYGVLGDHIVVRWHIKDGYELYRHSIKSSEGSLVEYRSRGKVKQDDFFGEVETLTGIAEAEISISNKQLSFIEVRYQGCKPKVVCYPEQRAKIPIPVSLLK